MSVALDFSDMFVSREGKRQNSSTIPVKENNLMSENCPPSALPGDSLTWVKNSLNGMNFAIKEDDISENTVPIWQKVLAEVSDFAITSSVVHLI